MDVDPLEGLDSNLRSALAAVELVALDVDGVLTDGGIVYAGAEEAQVFDVQDGAGIVWLVRAGVPVVWITGRGCAATERRARELGCALQAHVEDKQRALAALRDGRGLARAAVLAMGDDLADLGLAAAAGVFCAPANARAEVRARAAWVTRAAGGHGAVRELCEALLAARGAWARIVGDALS